MGRHSKPHTGRLYQPTDESRRHVTTMVGFGIQQNQIADMLEIDKKTLHKHYRRELDTGMTQANLRVVQSLYNNATQHMNVAAQIWWTKTRMGWKEAQDLNIGGTPVPIMVVTGVSRQLKGDGGGVTIKDIEWSEDEADGR